MGVISFSGALFFLNPKEASAGFFDFFTKITRAESNDSESSSDASVQTMQVLESPLSLNPKNSNVGENVLIFEDFLMAEIGPSGSIFDIYEESKTGEISVYVVREGDTLDSIAKMFSVSKNTIKWSNDLKTDKLKVGTNLTILPISGISYTVQKGDTLSSIAKKFSGDKNEILDFNGLESDSLSIGMKIIIPNGEMPSISVLNPQSKTPSISTNNIPAYSGYYMLPTQGIRTRGVKPGHKGVDIANRIGTPVYASAEGRVIVADAVGYNGGFGKYIVISHTNGTQTLYGHLSSVDTFVGEFVEQGELIGKMGNTGRSTGPHLHFEVRGAKNPF